ncbi:MAG TPA: M14 metallopeptidase family protein [Terriglobales bacterium]|nr:M14 metallopeptidase family protein [Terriglobales bacterium]
MSIQICRFFAVFCLLAATAFAQQAAPAAIPTPSKFLGFEVGADRQLADYKQISDYFRALDAASPRVEIQVLGKTTLDKDMIMAVISSEENLKNKQKYKDIARKLADPRGLAPAQLDALVKDGKLILLITCNIHSTEIGSSQMAMEWAYKLATAQDAETKKRLDDVILLLVPSLNPDGETMVTEWYRKYVGTKYEGGNLPYLYHHYVGHDNNRDWYMLTQKETRNMSQAVYHEWFPQFWLDEHQMGTTGPRIYVPPNADPVAKNVHPLVHRGNNLLGTNMAWRLEEAKKSGVIYNYSFDAYWPGGTRNTGWWKNMFGVLTEVASARIASPIHVDPSELSGGSKGLIDYKQQINFPNPWPGGTWRLRDIMDYELIISDATMETASKYKEEFLRGVASMANDAIRTAPADEFYRINKQPDPVGATRLADLMLQHGVEVRSATDGSAFMIPTSQPYGKFVDEMLGVQRYPEVRLQQGAGILAPYDVAAWSLPLMMGVDVEKVRVGSERPVRITAVDWPKGSLEGNKSNFYVVSTRSNAASQLVNDALKAGGKTYVSPSAGAMHAAFVFENVADLDKLAAKHHLKLSSVTEVPKGSVPLKPVRVGLYKGFTSSMDEGWTRWVLEQYGFNPQSVDNKAVKAGNLNANYDAIIIADVDKDLIIDGRSRREGYVAEMPPEYSGGIGKDGVTALKDFVQKGGTLITLASSSELVIDEFNLPIRNPLRGVRTEDFNVPGSLLRVHLDPSNPVNYGMPEQVAAFVSEPLAFQTSSGAADVQRNVLAWYPEDEQDILLSGWIKGADKLERKAAAASFRVGKGKIVMFAFRVQHRAQTEGTFKMLFNAIRWAGMEDGKN